MSDGAPDSYSPAALISLIQLVFWEYTRKSFSLGLNPAQWDALRFLAHAEERRCTASEFARFHRTKKATAGHTIAALVQKACLRRAPSLEDRRVTYLHVTEEGCALLKRDPITPMIEAATALSDHDRKVVEKFMVKILRNAPWCGPRR